jgi:hypothetical protein
MYGIDFTFTVVEFVWYGDDEAGRYDELTRSSGDDTDPDLGRAPARRLEPLR